MENPNKEEVVIEEKNGNTEKKVEIEVIPGKSEHEHHEYKKDGKNFNRNNQNNNKKFFKLHKKHCVLCQKGILYVDYKNIELLKYYVDGEHTGKILPRFLTGACMKHQRQISNAIHRARIVALLPFQK